MGKAQKLKEQRKLAGLQKEIRKEKRWKLTGMIAAGVSVGIIVGGLVFFGGVYLKNQFFSGSKKTTTNTSNDSALLAQAKVTKKGAHVYSGVPDSVIDTNKKYVAKFETASGSFEVTLDPAVAPKTVNNFVFLAKDGYYDGLTFHRIVKDFMIQGGDPTGNGSGGPGYKFDDETIPSSVDYTQGTIAMANSGKNTNGSQFFIMTGDYSGGKLPKSYTIFGKVSSGLDVVLKLNETKTVDNGGGELSKPVDKVVINKVTIEEK